MSSRNVQSMPDFYFYVPSNYKESAPLTGVFLQYKILDTVFVSIFVAKETDFQSSTLFPVSSARSVNQMLWWKTKHNLCPTSVQPTNGEHVHLLRWHDPINETQ